MFDYLPSPASTFAGDMDSLLYLIYYIVGAWGIALHVLLFYMFVRFRRREGKPAQYFVGRGRQLAWVLVPAILVLGLDLWIDVRGAAVWAAVKEDIPEGEFLVRVTGKQFNWTMTYPGPDGEFDTDDDYQAENALHVPVDTEILIELRSEDVLHSFFLPHMRLKQDAIPGRMIPVWFEAMKTGKYPIACAELCGFGHTTMYGRLSVDSPEEWRAWARKRWPKADPSSLAPWEGS